MATSRATLTDQLVDGFRILVQALQEDQSWLQTVRAIMERELPQELLPDETEWAATLQESFSQLLWAADNRDLGVYLAQQRQQTSDMAESGLPLRAITRGTSDLRQPITDHIRQVVDDLDDQRTAIDALDHMLMESLVIAGEVYAAEREDKVEDEFRHMIRRLSTPVIDVWHEIQILPLIGVIDSSRAQQMTEQLLERIVEQQARVVIIDITGVPTVDTAVADHLLKTTRAASLVGARAILVGISPQVAQTLVRLGVSLGDVETYADLRSGLERALASLGYSIERQAI